ncbi:MAG: hypothetical protein ABJB69_03145 [Spartobacteria bacterium]
MSRADFPQIISAAVAAFIGIFLSACESGPSVSASRTLPAYEARLAKNNFQNVHTTAYTHTEADHTQYGARNALGGELHAAGPAIHRAEVAPRATAVGDTDDVDLGLVSKKSAKPAKGAKRAVAVAKQPKIGSAAADWGRWPAGTTFRLLSTGQVYRIDDYGWALSGRNTIDLYMSSQRDMNSWGTRQEPIEVLHWGDTAESLRLLAPHQAHPHIKRMMLELEGREEEAAALR